MYTKQVCLWENIALFWQLLSCMQSSLSWTLTSLLECVFLSTRGGTRFSESPAQRLSSSTQRARYMHITALCQLCQCVYCTVHYALCFVYYFCCFMLIRPVLTLYTCQLTLSFSKHNIGHSKLLLNLWPHILLSVLQWVSHSYTVYKVMYSVCITGTLPDTSRGGRVWEHLFVHTACQTAGHQRQKRRTVSSVMYIHLITACISGEPRQSIVHVHVRS